MEQEIMAVNTATVRNAVNDIRKALQKSETDTQEVKEQLNNEEIWEADAKQALLSSYQKLSDFSKNEINSDLEIITKVCGLIDEYKDKVKKIRELQNQLASTDISPNEKLILNDYIRETDADRQRIEDNIRGLCGM